jgi:hypothetical protein
LTSLFQVLFPRPKYTGFPGRRKVAEEEMEGLIVFSEHSPPYHPFPDLDHRHYGEGGGSKERPFRYRQAGRAEGLLERCYGYDEEKQE